MFVYVSVLSRTMSVEADQRLHRFGPFPRTRFEAEQQNSQTERDYHRNYHCTANLFLRELHCHGARVGFHNPSFEAKG
jgi:hypothetical protein